MRNERHALTNELAAYLQQGAALTDEQRARRVKRLRRLAAHAGLAAQLDTVLLNTSR